MATVFLIRHGEPAVTGVFLGDMDPPLSDAGQDQCRQLQNLHVAAIWSSTLLRARQTAAFVTAHCLFERDELREISYGDWTGKTWVEIESNWGELARLKASNWLATQVPNGEQWRDFVERVNAIWQEIRRGPSPAAVVAHAGVNAVLHMLITGSDPLHFEQAHSEVIRIEFD